MRREARARRAADQEGREVPADARHLGARHLDHAAGRGLPGVLRQRAVRLEQSSTVWNGLGQPRPWSELP